MKDIGKVLTKHQLLDEARDKLTAHYGDSSLAYPALFGVASSILSLNQVFELCDHIDKTIKELSTSS